MGEERNKEESDAAFTVKSKHFVIHSQYYIEPLGHDRPDTGVSTLTSSKEFPKSGLSVVQDSSTQVLSAKKDKN